MSYSVLLETTKYVREISQGIFFIVPMIDVSIVTVVPSRKSAISVWLF